MTPVDLFPADDDAADNAAFERFRMMLALRLCEVAGARNVARFLIATDPAVDRG